MNLVNKGEEIEQMGMGGGGGLLCVAHLSMEVFWVGGPFFVPAHMVVPY